MSSCCLDLAQKIASRRDANIREHSCDVQSLNALKRSDSFYFKDSDSNLLKERPWRMDPNYFKKVYISSIALMKMTLHARSGGSIEIMGMMTGKIINNAIMVMDVYHLPVEGTETRVNAQAEGYEYMVQYLESLKQINRNENIVGWYHSHPGYGCWLSGIDVATQALNQNFQDPYLAIVIDPIKTAKQNKVEIGAFRTYPDNYKPPANNSTQGQQKVVPHSKRNDFGIHSEKYYSLDIELIKSSTDQKILNFLENKSWVSNILQSNSMKEINNNEINSKIINLLDSFKANDTNKLSRLEQVFSNLFDIHFENSITEKLLDSDIGDISGDSSNYATLGMNIDYSDSKKGSETNEDDEDVDEDSDLEDTRSKATTLDFSDADDAISMESSNALRNEDELVSYGNNDNTFENKLALPLGNTKREVNRKRGTNRAVYPKRMTNIARIQSDEMSSSENPNMLTKGNDENDLMLRNRPSRRRYNKVNNSLSSSNELARNIGLTAFQDFLVLDTQARLFLGS